MRFLPQSRAWVLFAAWGCAVGAALHIVCIFAGADWFDFLGAPPRYGQMMRDGEWLYPASVTAFIAAVLCVWAAYARSALEGQKPLPLARFVCAAVAGIFILRGLIGVPLVAYVLTKTGPTTIGLFHLAASFFILALGLGFVAAFKQLKRA